MEFYSADIEMLMSGWNTLYYLIFIVSALTLSGRNRIRAAKDGFRTAGEIDQTTTLPIIHDMQHRFGSGGGSAEARSD
jgi:hypothetical protein